MDCIFCKIINKEIPSKVVAENDKAIAFLDVNPVAKGHTLVIPKKHFANFSSTPIEYQSAVIELAQKIGKDLLANGAKGINYVSHENEAAGQVVFHYHLHVIPVY